MPSGQCGGAPGNQHHDAKRGRRQEKGAVARLLFGQLNAQPTVHQRSKEVGEGRPPSLESWEHGGDRNGMRSKGRRAVGPWAWHSLRPAPVLAPPIPVNQGRDGPGDQGHQRTLRPRWNGRRAEGWSARSATSRPRHGAGLAEPFRSPADASTPRRRAVNPARWASSAQGVERPGPVFAIASGGVARGCWRKPGGRDAGGGVTAQSLRMSQTGEPP